jgi:peptidoglycan/xylan/chitin deacetylase (PgdA/CDA1 family)
MLLCLYYHHITEHIPCYTNKRPGDFRRELEILSEDKWNFITPDVLLHGDPLSEKKLCLITFDDGYDSQFLTAKGILDEFNIKATFFIITGFVNQLNTWNEKRTYAASHLSWEQITELQQQGHVIGSHGISHRALNTLTDEEIEKEYAQSRSVLEEQLGSPIDFFAYPYGIDPMKPSISKYYKLAFATVRSNGIDVKNNPYAIRRDYLINRDQ